MVWHAIPLLITEECIIVCRLKPLWGIRLLEGTWISEVRSLRLVGRVWRWMSPAVDVQTCLRDFSLDKCRDGYLCLGWAGLLSQKLDNVNEKVIGSKRLVVDHEERCEHIRDAYISSKVILRRTSIRQPRLNYKSTSKVGTPAMPRWMNDEPWNSLKLSKAESFLLLYCALLTQTCHETSHNA